MVDVVASWMHQRLCRSVGISHCARRCRRRRQRGDLDGYRGGVVHTSDIRSRRGSRPHATGDLLALVFPLEPTGFYYLRARYYDPAIGQFLTVDPEVATTLSPHGYVAGNPFNNVDPRGLDGEPCPGYVSGGIFLLGALTSQAGTASEGLPSAAGYYLAGGFGLAGGAEFASMGADGVEIVAATYAAGDIGAGLFVAGTIATGGLLVVGLVVIAGSAWIISQAK